MYCNCSCAGAAGAGGARRGCYAPAGWACCGRCAVLPPCGVAAHGGAKAEQVGPGRWVTWSPLAGALCGIVSRKPRCDGLASELGALRHRPHPCMLVCMPRSTTFLPPLPLQPQPPSPHRAARSCRQRCCGCAPGTVTRPAACSPATFCAPFTLARCGASSLRQLLAPQLFGSRYGRHKSWGGS